MTSVSGTPCWRRTPLELGTAGSAAAVGNAIHNATGIRVRHVPVTLDKLLVD
ncbi:hypothetical protein [Streptomyces sp. NBC_01716]|uniref:hypothetical protein n=1 Tax=Streptomyces sp. NBC_01716 TaxID=2975917 RepID=UPI002E306B7D|nr:hypothetical protein [Streptomyces sp. NBC_01716]